MADSTTTLAEAAPPAVASKVRMLAPDGVVYSVEAAQSKVYQDHGYTPYSGPTIDEGGIEAKFGAWRNAALPVAKAAGLGAVNQVPFLDAGLDKFAPDTAHDLAEATAQARADHPYAYGAGSLGGAVGSFALGGAAVKAAAGAAGIIGAGTTLTAAAEASPILAGMASGAVGNAALNVADQVDSAALEHALSPEGQEKMAFSTSSLALAAGLGAAIPGLVGGLSGNLGRGARAIDKWAAGRLTDEFVDATEQQALADAGKGHVVKKILQPLVDRGQGSAHVNRELAKEVNSLALNQDNLLAQNGIRDQRLNIDEARGILSDARRELANSPIGHDDLRPLSDAVGSHDAVDAAQAAVANARSVGDAARAHQNLATAKAAVQDLPRDRELQQMSRALYDRIDFRAPTHNTSYPELLRAGRRVSAGRDAIFERTAPVEQASQFRRNRDLLSDHLAVVESLSKRHIPDVREALGKAQTSAAVAGSLAALGLRGGGIVGSAATGGGLALLYYANMRHLAAASRFVAEHMVGADKHLSDVIKAGLYSTSLPRTALHKYDFQVQAARVRAAQHDPATSYTNLHAGLLKMGVPEPVADRVAPRLHGMVQASAQALPKPQTTPDIASAVQPDLHQQRAWLSEHRSRMDPTYALAYPTAQNMSAAKQHHPETIMRAQEAVMDALHKNPYLPLASRMWAARVLGRPAGGLTNPAFYQSLSQMRAKADAEAQQSQGPAHSNGPSSMAQSEQSRLGELSTRQ